MVVHDIPLLVETGQDQEFDLVVTVEAGEEIRAARLVETRGLTREEAWRRIRAQATDQERAAIADAILDGSGDVTALHAQIDAFWELSVPR